MADREQTDMDIGMMVTRLASGADHESLGQHSLPTLLRALKLTQSQAASRKSAIAGLVTAIESERTRYDGYVVAERVLREAAMEACGLAERERAKEAAEVEQVVRRAIAVAGVGP